MVFKCVKGMYLLEKNYRDAFNLEAFISKYFEECFDKDMYIVGDISSEILRLKGFNTDPKSKNYFGFIDDYLDISCAFGCPYYVLKRIRSEEEFEKLKKEDKPVITEDDRCQIKPITKENFDKESLVLKTSAKGRPHIVIDSRKINAIPKGELPKDLKEEPREMNKKAKEEPEKNVVVETFVSSSEDFDPSKKKDFKGNRNNRPNNNNNKPRPDGNKGPKPNKPEGNKPKVENKPEVNKPKVENKPEENKPKENTPQTNPHHNNHNKNRNRNRNRNGGKPQNNKEGQQ